MRPEAQARAARAIMINSSAVGKTITSEAATAYVSQLVSMSARPSLEFVRTTDAERENVNQTITALGEGLRYGDQALRVGAAVIAGEVHDALLYAHDAPYRILGLPYDEDMGDRLDTLHTALQIQGPEEGTVQAQLVRQYVLPDGTPDAQQAAAQAIAGLTRTAG